MPDPTIHEKLLEALDGKIATVRRTVDEIAWYMVCEHDQWRMFVKYPGDWQRWFEQPVYQWVAHALSERAAAIRLLSRGCTIHWRLRRCEIWGSNERIAIADDLPAALLAGLEKVKGESNG